MRSMGWRCNIAVWHAACVFARQSGDPNEYVHVWVYENAGDREAKRAKLWSDPDWLAYVQKSAELGALERQKKQAYGPDQLLP